MLSANWIQLSPLYFNVYTNVYAQKKQINMSYIDTELEEIFSSSTQKERPKDSNTPSVTIPIQPTPVGVDGDGSFEQMIDQSEIEHEASLIINEQKNRSIDNQVCSTKCKENQKSTEVAKKDIFDYEQDMLDDPLGLDAEHYKKFPKITVTPEIQAILDKQSIELLAIKMESEKEARALAKKREDEKQAEEAKKKKKQLAELNAKIAREKKACKFLDECGYQRYELKNIIDELDCMVVNSTRHYQFFINKKGKVLTFGDWIIMGINGFLYVKDTFRNTCTLCHYDRETDELATFTTFASELEMIIQLEEIDPGMKKFGFRNFYPDYHFKKKPLSRNKNKSVFTPYTFSKPSNPIPKPNSIIDEELEKLFK